jgi:hypothetical protein
MKLLLFLLSFVCIPLANDSIVASQYWNCNRCNDTIIEKVVQRKKYVEVYYQVNKFRLPTEHFCKVYKK